MNASQPVRVYFGIGSNVEPEKTLKLACDELRARFSRVALSKVYRNPPIGFEGADFLNMVARVETPMSPPAVMSVIEMIHDCAGRVRGSDRFGPRELDVDLLMYGDCISQNWRVPRSDILSYAFVLRPLAELEPALSHPVSGTSMGQLWSEFSGDKRHLRLSELDVS